MKNLILISLIVLSALGCAAQTFTNGIKGSQLPTASTPLGGSEAMFLVQSGVTKQATVDQVQAKAIAANLATSNALVTMNNTTATLASLATNSVAIASNYLAKVDGTNAANLVTTSNALAANITATAASINGNFVNYYSVGNPSGFQTAAQVATAVNNGVATYAQTGLTNGGTATLNGVVYNVLKDPSGNGYPSSTVVIDLSAASLQNVVITNTSTVSVTLTGVASGQNVTVRFYNLSGAIRTINFPTSVSKFTAGTSVSVANFKYALFNFTSFGSVDSQVMFSASVQQ